MFNETRVVEAILKPINYRMSTFRVAKPSCRVDNGLPKHGYFHVSVARVEVLILYSDRMHYACLNPV